MTKRQAVLLLLSAVVSKMAHADEKGNIPSFPTMTGTMKQGITLNLDSFTGITVTMDGKQVTVTSAELFKALSS